jgi:hypothetical protein
MVVQGRHLDAFGKQFRHDRIDFALGEDEVAHHHGGIPRRLERQPTAEGKGGP